MKTQIISLFVLIGLELSEEARLAKSKRGSLLGDYALDYSDDLNLSQSGWKGLNTPSQVYGTHNTIPIHTVNTADFNLNVDLPPPPARRPTQHSIGVLPRPIQTLGVISSNSLDKPVMETQEYIPPQSFGSATLPQMPVPAVPVNALASNIPASRGAVFLGSGSLGVVALGNGAYALGSGSLGYSENRARPRPTARVPVYPPIPATPDLIPAAVPTPLPPQPAPPLGFIPGNYDHPLFNVPQVPQITQNGYEYLAPNRVGFGTPNPPRPPRTRQQFATPTALRLQVPQVPNDLQFAVPFGHSDLGNIPVLA